MGRRRFASTFMTMISEKQSKACLVCFDTWSILLQRATFSRHGNGNKVLSSLSLSFLVLPVIARCWWDKLLLTTILKQAKGKKGDTVYKKAAEYGRDAYNGTCTRLELLSMMLL